MIVRRMSGVLEREAAAIIAELRGQGHGWHTVARTLNARRVPTPSGVGQWWPDSARRAASDPAGWAAYMRRYRRRG